MDERMNLIIGNEWMGISNIHWWQLGINRNENGPG